MAYITGTISPVGAEQGFDLLLTALRDFLTTNATLVSLSQNWVLEKEETIPTYNMDNITDPTSMTQDFRDLYLRGPGLAQQDNIHVNIRLYGSSTLNYYNWMFTGATSFDDLLDWEDQPGTMIYTNTFVPVFTLTNSEIQYWIIGNGRRFMVVALIGGDWFLMYAGFILPYGKPSEFPYPMWVGGVSTNFTYSNTSSQLRNMANYNAKGYNLFRRPDGTVSSADTSGTSTSGVFSDAFWPPILGSPGLVWQGNRDGSFTLLPMVYLTRAGANNVWGEMDGVFHVIRPGVINLEAGDTITINSVDYLVIQNADKQEDYTYLAIKLE